MFSHPHVCTPLANPSATILLHPPLSVRLQQFQPQHYTHVQTTGEPSCYYPFPSITSIHTCVPPCSHTHTSAHHSPTHLLLSFSIPAAHEQEDGRLLNSTHMCNQLGNPSATIPFLLLTRYTLVFHQVLTPTRVHTNGEPYKLHLYSSGNIIHTCATPVVHRHT